MANTYILHSKSTDKYYIGMTQDSLKARIDKHNSNFYSKKYSSIASDWELFLNIKCTSVQQAISIEKHIKKMKSRKYIENLKSYSEMVKRLKYRFEYRAP